MNSYQRKIVKALMQRQFRSYEKSGTHEPHIFAGAIFDEIKDYDKHKRKYQQALIECVQLNYIIACRESRIATSYLVTENGVRSLTSWKERLLTAAIAIATSLITAAVIHYAPIVIDLIKNLLEQK